MLLNTRFLPPRLHCFRNLIIAGILLFFVLLTLVLDLVEANLQNSSYYLSESLLFSTYWLLFLPLIYLQLRWLKKEVPIIKYGLMLFVLISMHLLAYPALVWILSGLFYNHTFSYGQTFQYGVTQYLVKTGLVYFIPVLGKLLLFRKVSGSGDNLPLPVPINQNRHIASIVVTDANHRKLAINTEDILYFSARYPYINIHHGERNYLHNENLKSMESQLNCRKFVRIHKSCIVNLSMVDSYKSRLNGDYDIQLKDGTILRLSRNYASAFKEKYESSHQVT